MDATRLFLRQALILGFYLLALPAAATQWSIRDLGQSPVYLTDDSGASELSGLTWVGGNDYYAVSDGNGAKLFPVTIVLNDDGTIASAQVGAGVVLAGGVDLEGVAYTGSSTVYDSDESGPALREHSPSTGALVRTLTVPPVFSNIRNNLGLESLSLEPTTHNLWTANEEALTVDGPLSGFTFGSGTVVRIQRFDASLNPSGQWAYQTDFISGDVGNPGRDVEASGVSDLIAMQGGELLVLERATGGGSTFIRGRLYQVDFNGATDVSALSALDGATYAKVKKTQLWSRSQIAYNFEGATLGPDLPGGGRSLLLVSDNGSNLQQALYALVIRPAICGNGSIEAPEICDDSNSADGDGCSATCHTEVCGDGKVNNGGRETCDDGNTIDGDGCGTDCQIENEARRCQQTIVKAARGYAFDRFKALRVCHDQLNRGRRLFLDEAETVPLTDPSACADEIDTRAKLQRAANRLRNAIANPMQPRCSDTTVALMSLCATTVDGLVGPNGDSGCIVDNHNAQIDRMIDDEFGRVLQASERNERKCQDIIAKASAKYVDVRWQALNICQTQLLRGRMMYTDPARTMQLTDSAQCAQELKTVRKISRAREKMRDMIAGSARQACNDGLLSNLGSACATTVDGLVAPNGAGGCLITSHDAAVDAAIAATR